MFSPFCGENIFKTFDVACAQEMFRQSIPVVGVPAADFVGVAAQDLGDGARYAVVDGAHPHLPLAVRAHRRVRQRVEQLRVAERVRQRGRDQARQENVHEAKNPQQLPQKNVAKKLRAAGTQTKNDLSQLMK
jgi:hypothetical protein